MFPFFYLLSFLCFLISLFFLFQAKDNHDDYWYLLFSNFIFHLGFVLFYYFFSNLYFSFFSIFFCFLFTLILIIHIKKEIPPKILFGIPYLFFQFYIVLFLLIQLIQSI